LKEANKMWIDFSIYQNRPPIALEGYENHKNLLKWQT